MTLLQVRIRDAREAAMAAAAGIDCVEVVIGTGAAPDATMVRDVRRAFSGPIRLRWDGNELDAAAAAGADEVAVGVRSLANLDRAVPGGLRLVAIVPPSDATTAVSQIGKSASAVMLDASSQGRLVDHLPIAALDAFADACRAHHLAFGFGGGLEAPDIARLLLLEPDMLAFETAVRRDHALDGPLDPHALDAIRALVPRGESGSAKQMPKKKISKVTDRVFIRDFEVSLAIGAYKAEHGKRQRVRFGIVADTVRVAGPPHDMRDVFSYDIMIETIRVLSERPHVTFVETLAEDVAAAILAHAEVASVTVTVEKLDIINGSVGIEITRRRDGS